MPNLGIIELETLLWSGGRASLICGIRQRARRTVLVRSASTVVIVIAAGATHQQHHPSHTRQADRLGPSTTTSDHVAPLRMVATVSCEADSKFFLLQVGGSWTAELHWLPVPLPLAWSYR